MLETTPKPEDLSPRINFVYCEHIPENIPAVVKGIGDAEIVGLELHSGTSQERDGVKKLLNTLSSKNSDANAKNSALSELIVLDGTPDESFVVGIASALQSTGKKIELVDMAGDDPKNELLIQTEAEAERAFVNAVRHSGPSKVKESFTHMLDTKAATARARESRVGEQIEELANHNPGLKIAIVQGMVHTPTSFPYMWSGKSKRSFVMNNEVTNTAQFAPTETALRTKNIFPEKELGEEIFKRALLDQLVFMSDPLDDGTYAAKLETDLLDSEIDRFHRGLMKGLGGKVGRLATKNADLVREHSSSSKSSERRGDNEAETVSPSMLSAMKWITTTRTYTAKRISDYTELGNHAAAQSLANLQAQTLVFLEQGVADGRQDFIDFLSHLEIEASDGKPYDSPNYVVIHGNQLDAIALAAERAQQFHKSSQDQTSKLEMQ